MSLLERLQGTLQEYFETERVQASCTRAYKASPVLKLACTVWLGAFVNYVSPRPATWLAVGCASAVAAVAFDLPLKRYFAIVATLGVAFPLVVALPLPFLTRGEVAFEWGFVRVTREGAHAAGDLVARVFANASVVAFFAVGTPVSQVIHALKHLRVPKVLVTILLLTYRYFFLFFENLVQVLRADECRRFEPYPVRERFNHLGTILGTLVLRSVRRGEAVYRAMLARGFGGELPVAEFHRGNWQTVAYLAAAALTTLVALLAGAWASASAAAPNSSCLLNWLSR
ncbi:MAG: hypothetical protein Kow0069_03150 [Promethearchaeota archaeon]